MAEPEKPADSLRWADAWQLLVYEHSPYRPADNGSLATLLQLDAIERLFLDNPELRGYYAEWEPSVRLAPTEASDRRATIHVAAMQLQLMEDGFYFLRLDRYANAPDNRGWMNLFRRWSMSPTFREHVNALEEAFSKPFIDFYRLYIEAWAADLPVPHPWDVRSEQRGGQPKYAYRTKDALERCKKTDGKGIFLDPGRVEAGVEGYYEPRPVKTGEHGAPEPRTRATEHGSGKPARGAHDSSESTD